MNFFPLDPALKDALSDFSNHIQIVLILTFSDLQTLTITHENLKTAQVTSRTTQDGVILTTGELTFTLPEGSTPQSVTKGEIHLSAGACGINLHRFTMTPDEKNLKHLQEGGRDDLYRLFLEDSLARIKRTKNLRDWTSAETLVDSAVCDKEHPEKSLFHTLALKAGVPPGEIDCVSIPLTVPYAKLIRSPYAELCDLARAMHARLSSGTDKTLILSDSRYQEETPDETEIPTLEETLFYHLSTHTAGDNLYNDIRLKWNKPVHLSYQTLWIYQDEPVQYDGSLNPSYPFSLSGVKRDIETNPTYQAPYTAALPGGEKKPVVYANNISRQDEVENRMITDFSALTITHYDTTTYPDRALINLECTADDRLQNLFIEGAPIVVLSNQACYRRDQESIDQNGLKILNHTGKYFLDQEVNGTPHFEDWTNHTLFTHKEPRRRFTGKTQHGLFYPRVGARTYLSLETGETPLTRVTELILTYSVKEGFTAQITLEEEKES